MTIYDFNKTLNMLDGHEKTFIDYGEQYKLNLCAAFMCSVLRLYTDNSPDGTSPGFSPDAEMSDVYSPFIEASRRLPLKKRRTT